MTRLALLVGAASVAAAYDFNIPSNNLAKVNALAKIDPDRQACATAGDVVSYCAYNLPYDAAATESASCYCCNDATFLAPMYSSCEDYIISSAAEYTDDYSVVSIAESLCLAVSEEGFRCGGVAATTTPFGGASQTGSQPAASVTATGPAQTTAAGGDGSAPPACTSFASVFSSCDNKIRGFETMNDEQVATCLCYKNGAFTTALDDYILTCAQWVKTAEPDEYESYVAVESFCARYGSDLTASGNDVATFGDGGDGGSGSSSTDNALSFNTNTNTATTTKAPQHTVTVTPSPTAAQNGASGPVQAGSGLAAWLAVVLPFVL